MGFADADGQTLGRLVKGRHFVERKAQAELHTPCGCGDNVIAR